MDMVNADAAELLQFWNKIKTAITSVENTKCSMMRGYQQLGGEWKDKKYKELKGFSGLCDLVLIISGL